MTELHVQNEIAALVAERDWAQFHTPENLAKSIFIEAGEFLECFQWNRTPITCGSVKSWPTCSPTAWMLADRLGVDPNRIVLDKLAKTREKYPAEKARGEARSMTPFEIARLEFTHGRRKGPGRR